jgi:hypothetical protein
MVQLLLPLFPADATMISSHLGVQLKGDTVFYFNGPMPVFQHSKDDYESFRLFTSQCIVNGNCSQMEIVRCFGVSKISVKRWVKKFHENNRLEVYFTKKKR